MSLPTTSATGKLNGPRPPIREMLRARTRELALRAGRTAAQVSQVDYEQAKRDLTGESEMDRQDVVLDSPPHWAIVQS